MMRAVIIIAGLVASLACDGDYAQVQNTATSNEAQPLHIYGACDAQVVMDRVKNIDISSEGEFHRPAIFKLTITADVPTALEMMMLASRADGGNEPLYLQDRKPLKVEVVQQPDIHFRDGERTINRYRGNSAARQDSVDIDWYDAAKLPAESNEQRVARVVRVDFASDPYTADGAQRWGEHYVCHHNVGIKALARDRYDLHIHR